ncbi:MAG TPA: 6,7-dimethyl-8-ribityllumazine synthase [Chitinophagaceae bacterium]|nr:6,7-dimethyl-8-ribityllumazine synthase [Chitinophagaceae bacterium]
MAVLKNQDKVLAYSHLERTKGKHILIVATEWNTEVVDKQIEGALKIAEALEIKTTVLYVPGAIEIPYGVKIGVTKATYDGVITFGAVIRGGTPHFDYVSKYVTEGVLALNLSLNIPVVFGVLTLDTIEQAWERIGGKHGHKGEEAMITAAKMTLL